MRRLLPIAVLVMGLVAGSAFAASKSGSFRGEAGESVRGKATWSTSGSKSTIRLSGGFKSSSGPDLYVYVGNGRPSRQIAKLRRISGTQTYSVPASVNLSKYSTIFIHCKRYNHIFGRARLN